jgi:antitoxin (DNA-binding transcriptional repressor) of toxin-antitoxin stability system
MESVTVRELQEQVHELLDRVADGETVLVSRDGAAIAELRPRPHASRPTADLIATRRRLPAVDPILLRSNVDATIDGSV